MNIEKMYSTIDTHVAGEAFRIVKYSPIVLNEANITLNNEQLQTYYQTEKSVLLNEPRGHRDMHGCIIVPSSLADFGVLFFNHDRDVQFKYGGLVATITALLETGNLKQREDQAYKIETIDGIHRVKVTTNDQEVTSVYLESGQCKVYKWEENYQIISADGKRDYALLRLPEEIPTIHLDYLSMINEWGKKMTNRLVRLHSLDGMIVIEPINGDKNNVRSVTFVRDGTILRSPGFDSTFAILTALREKNKSIQQLSNKSIFNSHLTAIPISKANRFSIETEGFITGIHEFVVDPDDPLQDGFILK